MDSRIEVSLNPQFPQQISIPSCVNVHGRSNRASPILVLNVHALHVISLNATACIHRMQQRGNIRFRLHHLIQCSHHSNWIKTVSNISILTHDALVFPNQRLEDLIRQSRDNLLPVIKIHQAVPNIHEPTCCRTSEIVLPFDQTHSRPHACGTDCSKYASCRASEHAYIAFPYDRNLSCFLMHGFHVRFPPILPLFLSASNARSRASLRPRPN